MKGKVVAATSQVDTRRSSTSTTVPLRKPANVSNSSKLSSPKPAINDSKKVSINLSVRSIAITEADGISAVGDHGEAKSSIRGIALSGKRGFSEADDYGLAISGEEGVSKVGLYGIGITGKNGVLSFKYWSGKEFTYASVRCEVKYGADFSPNVAYMLKASQLITQQYPMLGTGHVAISNFEIIPTEEIVKMYPRLKEYLPGYLTKN